MFKRCKKYMHEAHEAKKSVVLKYGLNHVTIVVENKVVILSVHWVPL